MTEEGPHPLSYATPVPPMPAPPPPPFTTPRRMFFLLLPAGIWCGTLVPSIIISSFHQDDRNMGGACILVVLAPVAVACLIKAFLDCATKEGGDRAFMIGCCGTCFWSL